MLKLLFGVVRESYLVVLIIGSDEQSGGFYG